MVIPVSNTSHLACANEHHFAPRRVEELAKVTGRYEIGRGPRHGRMRFYLLQEHLFAWESLFNSLSLQAPFEILATVTSASRFFAELSLTLSHNKTGPQNGAGGCAHSTVIKIAAWRCCFR
jgi:hypothetical protein